MPDRPEADEPAPTPPTDFGEFTLEIETMPDGRLIQYYRWPAPADRPAPATAPDSPADV